MPEITQWDENEPPDALIDDIENSCDAFLDRLFPIMDEFAEEGGAVLVTLVQYDPLTKTTLTRTETRGNYLMAYAATELWVKRQD